MSPLDCDACYRCEACGLPTCADERPSPAEDRAVCADCADTWACFLCGREVDADAEPASGEVGICAGCWSAEVTC